MMIRLATMVAFVVTCAAATPAFAQQSADGFFTTSDGVKIHYLTLGSSGSWVVLIDGFHLTAIAVGGPMPPQYTETLSRFIDMFDAR
jgi:hypothetical protein